MPPTMKKLAEVIHEWSAWDDARKRRESYRLIAVAKYTVGYRDAYVIEQLSENTLGEPTWSILTRWEPGHNYMMSNMVAILFTAIESIKLEHAQTHFEVDGWSDDASHNETCKHCGEHISRHYGEEKRCKPLPNIATF